MYFQPWTVLFALLTAETVSGRALSATRNHYKRADVGDVRSPCPALNTLANHGYLPRNGKAITAAMLTTSIQDVYNFDSFLGYAFGHLAIPLVENYSLIATTLDLDHLDLHDAIEHDASLSRNDFSQGDNHSLQPMLLDAFIDDAEGNYLTVESLAKSRVRRERESAAAGSPKLGTLATSLGFGEAALILQAFGIPNGTAGTLLAPKAAVDTWFREERLPDGYVKPAQKISISSTSTWSSAVQSLANKIKGI